MNFVFKEGKFMLSDFIQCVNFVRRFVFVMRYLIQMRQCQEIITMKICMIIMIIIIIIIFIYLINK